MRRIPNYHSLTTNARADYEAIYCCALKRTTLTLEFEGVYTYKNRDVSQHTPPPMSTGSVCNYRIEVKVSCGFDIEISKTNVAFVLHQIYNNCLNLLTGFKFDRRQNRLT